MSNQDQNQRQRNDAEDQNQQSGGKNTALNPDAPEDTTNTNGDSANGKYSHTDKRDEDMDNNQVRGGS